MVHVRLVLCLLASGLVVKAQQGNPPGPSTSSNTVVPNKSEFFELCTDKVPLCPVVDPTPPKLIAGPHGRPIHAPQRPRDPVIELAPDEAAAFHKAVRAAGTSSPMQLTFDSSTRKIDFASASSATETATKDVTLTDLSHSESPTKNLQLRVSQHTLSEITAKR